MNTFEEKKLTIPDFSNDCEEPQYYLLNHVSDFHANFFRNVFHMSWIILEQLLPLVGCACLLDIPDNALTLEFSSRI